MKPLAPLAALIFCGLLTVLAAPAAAQSSACIDWTRVMTQYELDRAPKGPTLLVQPFTDYTKKEGDDWLSTGLRNYLADLLKSGANLRVLAGNTAIHGAETGDINYTVSGKFEHLPDTLRVFVSLKNSSGELVRQIAVSAPYPYSKDFFTEIAGAAGQILDFIKAKKNPSEFERVRDATPSTRAYENYSRGRDAAESLSPARSESAVQFFTRAKRDDYRSPLGYEGLIDLYSFLGFYHKQQGEPFSSYFQKAEGEMNEMKKLAGEDASAPPARGTKKAKVHRSEQPTDRFIAGDIAFREGFAATRAAKSRVAASPLYADNWKKAAAAFKRSVELVPEDAVSWRELSRALTALDDAAGAEEAMQRARGINSCI